MDTPGAVDIFATKGLEYLIVIGYLVLLVAFWRLLRPAPRRSSPRAPGWASPPGSWFEVRDDLFYHQGHGWARYAPESSVVRVGMDDFAQRLLGPPAALTLPALGTRLTQGEHGWDVVIDSTAIGMLSPVDGEVVAVNDAVREDPTLVSADPYDRGWLLDVRVPRFQAARKHLLHGRVTQAWIAETAERLRAMPAGELGVLLPDGGFPVSGLARALSPEGWADVARQLLLTD